MVANYGFRDEEEDQKPIEVQATSPVIYYTTIGPPLPPFVRVLNVGLYQVTYDTASQAYAQKSSCIVCRVYQLSYISFHNVFLSPIPTQPPHSEQTL